MNDQDQKFQTLSDFYSSKAPKPYSRRIQNDNPAVFHSFRQHIMEGRPAGSFVEAVLKGDFYEVTGRADDRMQKRLVDIATYFQSCAPMGCFGSEEIATDWRDDGGLVGIHGEEVALEIAHRKSL